MKIIQINKQDETKQQENKKAYEGGQILEEPSAEDLSGNRGPEHKSCEKENDLDWHDKRILQHRVWTGEEKQHVVPMSHSYARLETIFLHGRREDTNKQELSIAAKEIHELEQGSLCVWKEI